MLFHLVWKQELLFWLSLTMSCMQFKDATNHLALRQRVHCDVSSNDWSRLCSAPKASPRPQVQNGTVREDERQRLLTLADIARERLFDSAVSGVPASASTRTSSVKANSKAESEEAEWNDENLKTPCL